MVICNSSNRTLTHTHLNPLINHSSSKGHKRYCCSAFMPLEVHTTTRKYPHWKGKPESNYIFTANSFYKKYGGQNWLNDTSSKQRDQNAGHSLRKMTLTIQLQAKEKGKESSLLQIRNTWDTTNFKQVCLRQMEKSEHELGITSLHYC